MHITAVSIATLASANIALYLTQLLTVSRCIKAPKNALKFEGIFTVQPDQLIG